MANFTENMKAFTGRLQMSIDDRAESLASVHQATTDLLDAARTFLDDVALGNELRADEVEAMLAQSHADRSEMVQAMRQAHRDEHAAMSHEMRRMFDETRKHRTDDVTDFMTTSRADRLEAAQAMRATHREQLAMMSEELHATLDEANRMRLETVGTMRRSFQEAQKSLATDLRDASMTWRQFAAGR